MRVFNEAVAPQREGLLVDIPEELRVYEHRPKAEDVLKKEYVEKGLDAVPDTFALVRIIGNDLYPRHSKGQSRTNLHFILENEPPLENCRKIWIVNRIVDEEERSRIIKLLCDFAQEYAEIPFEAAEFEGVCWDFSRFKEEGFLSSRRYLRMDEIKRGRAYVAVYRNKNKYVMNNNGARNYAIAYGSRHAKWVLPWDGNCFVTKSAWKEITESVKAAAHLKYFVVPMERVLDNKRLLDDSYQPNPVEEPQLIFRRDAEERFDEEFPYGRRPKVELFWRLGIPGKWDKWKDEPWDPERRGSSQDSGNFGVAGWVARLFSGQSELEKTSKESFVNRGLVRQEAIVSTIEYVQRKVLGQADELGLMSFETSCLEEMRSVYRDREENSFLWNVAVDVLDSAEEALIRKPGSVIDKSSLPPSGDPKDYFHPAPYWWPNPDTPDGLPYVRRDGQRVPGTLMYEPASEKYDRTRLQYLFDDVTKLSLAHFITGDERYARHAVAWLRRWFIAGDSRMNPHLRYAQVRLGRNGNEGEGRGIIEMKDMYYFLDAARLLICSGEMSEPEEASLKAWLEEYLEWLLNSEQGISECAAPNNHGTYYDLQVAAIAAFLGKYDVVHATLIRAKNRIPVQFSPAGIQYDEMTRTQTAHYCCYNLQGWLNIAMLGRRFGESFDLQGDDSARIGRAVEWVMAHLDMPWPYEQIEDFDTDRLLVLAHYASRLGLFELSPQEASRSFEAVNKKFIFHPHDGIRPYWAL